ncbi:NUDIX domain-containing protein [Corallococcus sp. 4LFB]
MLEQGGWCLVGGGVRAGESVVAAAARHLPLRDGA